MLEVGILVSVNTSIGFEFVHKYDGILVWSTEAVEEKPQHEKDEEEEEDCED